MASRLEGFDSLAAALRELRDPKEVGKTLRKGVRAGMREPLKRARQLIPVGVDAHVVGRWKGKGRVVAPGFAKRSIRVITKVAKGGQMAYALLGVRAEAYYAVQFVELGTSKMAAQPWLRPAFLGSKDPQLQALGGEINEWIKGLASRHRSRGNSSRAAQLESNAATFGPGYNAD